MGNLCDFRHAGRHHPHRAAGLADNATETLGRCALFFRGRGDGGSHFAKPARALDELIHGGNRGVGFLLNGHDLFRDLLG